MNGLTFGQAVAIEIVKDAIEKPGRGKELKDVLNNALLVAVELDAGYPIVFESRCKELREKLREKQGE